MRGPKLRIKMYATDGRKAFDKEIELNGVSDDIVLKLAEYLVKYATPTKVDHEQGK